MSGTDIGCAAPQSVSLFFCSSAFHPASPAEEPNEGRNETEDEASKEKRQNIRAKGPPEIIAQYSGFKQVRIHNTSQESSNICLRACYAMPGTDVACAAICLCTCYAMPGTDAPCESGLGFRTLGVDFETHGVGFDKHEGLSPYACAMYGIAYALATRCPVLTLRMLLLPALGDVD
eukprot:2537100-Rhodomonas_salina.2